MKKEEFAEIVLASTDSLYRVSKAILKEDSDCEDAVQEAIAIAFDKLDTLRKDKYAKTWLTRILIHECYALLRQRTKTLTLAENWEMPVTERGYAEVEEDYSGLYEALKMLNDDQRLTMVLYHLEEYSVKEIAQIMEVSTGTVKSRLARGRNRLRDLLEEDTYGYIG